jgi:hypothetical protein
MLGFFCSALLGASGGALLVCLGLATAMSLTHRSFRRDWKSGELESEPHPMSGEAHHRESLRVSHATGQFYRRQP